MKKPKIGKEIKDGIKDTVKEIEHFEWKHRNLLFLLISIAIGYFILRSNFIQTFIENSGSWGYAGSFITGLVFPYGLTVLPATAAFLILSGSYNLLFIALTGAIGAVTSDYIIFRFIGNRMVMSFEEIAGDVSKTLKGDIEKMRKKAVKSKVFHHLVPIIAGFIIASPLPDELAAVLFSSVKFKLRKFLIYAFIFHFIGILLIATIGKIF